MAVGLLVYLSLPLRAAAHPPVNWGQADTWQGFWWLVLAQPYQGFWGDLPAQLWQQRLAAWAAMLVQQFGLVGLLLGFWGLVYASPRLTVWRWFTMMLALLVSLVALGYDTSDSLVYLLPVYVIFAIWIGVGVALALERVGQWHVRAKPWCAAVLALALLWPAMGTMQQVSLRNDLTAYRSIQRVLHHIPPDAIVITRTDIDTFPLWYAHYARTQRADIAVLVEPLLHYAWYRENMRRFYHDLVIPEKASAEWVDRIAASNRERTVCVVDSRRRRMIMCPRESEYRSSMYTYTEILSACRRCDTNLLWRDTARCVPPKQVPKYQ
ncbi:MAG: hypothetical protein HC837_00430 [Chloroflexaceae bacterium]|nr:hypothetical protein [Chloroflexaceae bacterium]